MPTPPLRAVGPDDRPAPPKTVTQAATNGTYRELLVAMRDRIAITVEAEGTAPRDLAALTKRLADIARDIEAIDARDGVGEGTPASGGEDEAFDGTFG